MKNLDKYQGCLIGGAVGDALGYPVEFWDEGRIFDFYGPGGITDYALDGGLARISDDTQMTLFTANGLLLCTAKGMKGEETSKYAARVGRCYRDWMKTQGFHDHSAWKEQVSWLNNIQELHCCRAPGNTCISALRMADLGLVDCPINHSKGCGGVMRVAPVGLYFGDDSRAIEDIDRLGAETAALTHGHPLGYLPAALLAHILHLLVHNSDMSVLEAVEDGKQAMGRSFGEEGFLPKLLSLVDQAIALAADGQIPDLQAIHALGEGWVAEEALAIALYCALRHEESFEKGVVAAVNHKGDSDSTGAITGNILGARLGLKGIPPKYLSHLEMKHIILELADDLFYGGATPGREEAWAEKYVYYTYSGAEKSE